MRDSEAAASAETRPTAAMTARSAFFAPRSDSFRPQTPSMMSRWTVCAASTISESSVESIAENTAATTTPAIIGWNFCMTSAGKANSGSATDGSMRRQERPSRVLPEAWMSTHATPRTAACESERSSRAVMKRCKMCGCPMRPRPPEASPAAKAKAEAPVCPPPAESSAGSIVQSFAQKACQPPACMTKAAGKSASTASIATPCATSVQTTAL